MTAMDDRIWLHHAESDGYWHAPVEAVEQWAELGWAPCDAPPAEPNPTTAEYVALTPPPAPESEPEPEPAPDESADQPTNASRRGATKNKEQ